MKRIKGLIIGVYTLPVLLTFINVFCAFSACILAWKNEFAYAIVLFMVAGIFDLFDGVVARKCKRTQMQKQFGIQIDSLADVCSFGVTPVVIGIFLGMNTLIDFIIMGLYLGAALMRLAYFNCQAIQEEGRVSYYTGLPVTYSTIILPIVIVIAYLLTGEFSLWILRIAYIMIAVLFVLRIKLPKPKGKWYAIFPALTIVWAVVTILIL